MQIRSIFSRALMVAGLAMVASTAAKASDRHGITYRVTVTNLTAGQPFTPPVVAVHNRRADVYSLGEPVNEGVRQIAENGNLEPLVTALSSDPNVSQVITGTAPIVPAGNPGGTAFDSEYTVEFTTSGRARRLSIVSMLICTNDGFTGIDSVRLPVRGKTTILARGYDTRTEKNTEDFADIVPPCQGLIGVSSDDTGTGASNPELAENGVIIPHPGVVGDNDLDPRVHDWADPVARIVIERVSPRRYY
ncbi:MAG: spondin domain-containing protein [Pseudomonadota bacterium]